MAEIIMGIDHGNGNMKGVHVNFPCGLVRYTSEPGRFMNEDSRKVDAGSTNTLIDQIFLSIEDLIDAKMVCGAGGGGFLQVILKKGVQKADVHKRLKDVFQDNPVDVWDCEII